MRVDKTWSYLASKIIGVFFHFAVKLASTDLDLAFAPCPCSKKTIKIINILNIVLHKTIHK